MSGGALFWGLGQASIWTRGGAFFNTSSPINDLLEKGEGAFTLEELMEEARHDSAECTHCAAAQLWEHWMLIALAHCFANP